MDVLYRFFLEGKVFFTYIFKNVFILFQTIKRDT